MKTGKDTAFLARVEAIVEAHLDEEGFSVEVLARQVGLSRVQLHRRLHRAIGMAPGTLIRQRRLDRAAQLLRGGDTTVTEVVYAVGWNSLSHFARVFRDHFGLPPSAYSGAPGPPRPGVVGSDKVLTW